MSRPADRAGADGNRADRNGADRLAAARGRGGFTLIELIVSIALLSLVLTLVYGSFFQLSDGAQQLKERLSARQELRLLARLVADDLRAVQWLGQFEGDSDTRLTGMVAELEFVDGSEFSNLNFHAAVSARFHRDLEPGTDPRLHEIGYRVRKAEDRDTYQLLRREDFYLDDDITEGGVEVPLADGIEVFRVTFLREAVTSGEEDWRERWGGRWATSDEPHLPAAIRVELTQATPDGRRISETVEFNLKQKP